MKRFGAWLAWGTLATMTAGCTGGGLQEGSPSEPVKSSQTNEFKELMQKNMNKMQHQSRKLAPKGGD